MPKLKVNRKLEPFLLKSKPIKVAIGGRGCVSGDTLIDTPTGSVRIDRFEGGIVKCMTIDGEGVAMAERPIKYAPQQLYRISLCDGRSIECTDQHRFLTPLGWRDLLTVRDEHLQICDAYHPLTNLEPSLSGSLLDVLHYFQILAGFLYCYFWYYHQYDRQPLQAPSTYQDVFQLLAGEQLHNSRVSMRKDGQEFWSIHNSSQFLYLLSSFGVLLSKAGKSYEGSENYSSEILSGLLSGLCRLDQRFHESNSPDLLVQQFCGLFQGFGTSERFQDENLQIISDILLLDVDDSSYSDTIGCKHSLHYTKVDSVVKTSISNYWDMFVPLFNNYLSNGIVNHNSGKSIGFGDIFTMKMDTENADIYCLREYQDSINDSVHRVFSDSINKRLQLTGWSIQENRVVSPRGSKTTYRGAARNPDSIQSAQGYKYSWFEEAHRASKDSLDKLLPTILRNPGAECWFSANPQSSLDPFSQRFITPYLSQLERDGYYEDELHLIIIVNWRDNPWWSEEQEVLRLWDYNNRPRSEYDWIWEGKFNDAVEDSIIKPEWVDAAINAHEKLGFKPVGLKCLSFDPADSGDDDKASVTRHGSVITHAQAWSDGELPEAIDKAFDTAFEQRADVLIYDGDGLGAGVKVGLAARTKGKKISVQSYKGSNSVDNPDETYVEAAGDEDVDVTNADTFKNKRAQYWWYLRDRLEATYNAVEKQIYTDPDKMISFDPNLGCMMQLKAELCRVKRKRTSNNSLIQIESKAEMKKRNVPSPNLADALVMSFANEIPVFAMNERKRTPRRRSWRAA